MRLTLLILALITTQVSAQSFEDIFADQNWLLNHMEDDNVVVIQVGNGDIYNEAHIPGAAYMSNGSFISTSIDSLYVQLPELEDFQKELSRRGIDSDKMVVICSDSKSFAWAYRLYVTFKYYGISSQAKILNGGLKGWQANLLAISQDSVVAQPTMSSIPLVPQPQMLVDKQWLLKNMDNPEVQVIDARRPGYYSGEEKGSYSRSGHIGGANNITWTTLVDDNHFLISEDALANKYKEAGLDKDKILVSYCHVGLRASVIYTIGVALGLEAELYDGSYNEWDRLTANYTVESGQ
jgi:thiosulfate/3-mercaptopyruvate sulfurtransferase